MEILRIFGDNFLMSNIRYFLGQKKQSTRTSFTLVFFVYIYYGKLEAFRLMGGRGMADL